MKVSDTEAVRLLLRSLKIYSPTKAESELASFLADSMEKIGYSKVRLDRAGNVIGTAGKGKRSLLLCGHMDTVPGELPIRRKAGAIYGRGAADAKSPLCALLVAGALAADSGVSITYAGVTEEEGDGKGVEQLIRGSAAYDYAVFGEPSGADRLTIGYRGRVAIGVGVRTGGGHAGSPWAHRSAFEEFASLMARLKDYERSKEVQGDHFRSLSISPTLVKAGSYQNVIPSACEATLDLRLPPSIDSSTAIRDIRGLAKAGVDGVRITITPGAPTEAYEADADSRLVRAFQRAILIRLKAKPRLIRKTGTGDMNTFALKKKSECLTYGPGLSPTSHSDGEMVMVRDYLDSIWVVREAIAQLETMSEGDVMPSLPPGRTGPRA